MPLLKQYPASAGLRFARCYSFRLAEYAIECTRHQIEFTDTPHVNQRTFSDCLTGRYRPCSSRGTRDLGSQWVRDAQEVRVDRVSDGVKLTTASASNHGIEQKRETSRVRHNAIGAKTSLDELQQVKQRHITSAAATGRQGCRQVAGTAGTGRLPVDSTVYCHRNVTLFWFRAPRGRGRGRQPPPCNRIISCAARRRLLASRRLGCKRRPRPWAPRPPPTCQRRPRCARPPRC
jgi:hypothetical protein